MPIEFRCTQCNRLLRTQDETAGKKAKCPECGTILTIPTPGRPPEAAAPPGATGVSPVPGEHGQHARATPPPGTSADNPFGPIPPPPAGPASPFAPSGPAESENPYASPADYTLGAPAGYATVAGPIVPARIEVGDVFERAWTIYKDQMAMCIGGVLIVLIVNYVVGQVFNYGSMLIGAVAGDETMSIVLWVLGLFAAQLFALWLNLGLTLMFLKIGRGQEASLGDLFQGGPFFLTALVAGILVACMTTVGYVLLIVPGIILALMFSQFLKLIVDRNVGIIESIELSMKVTQGNKLTLFLLGIVSFGLILAGFLMCCVGVIFTAPLVTLMGTVAYLAMTGQPTAERRQQWQVDTSFAGGAGQSPFTPPAGNSV